MASTYFDFNGLFVKEIGRLPYGVFHTLDLADYFLMAYRYPAARSRTWKNTYCPDRQDKAFLNLVHILCLFRPDQSTIL